MVDVNEILFSELNLLRVGKIYLFLLWSSCQYFSWFQGTPALISQKLWGFAPLLGRRCMPLFPFFVPCIRLQRRALLGTESKCFFASSFSLQFSLIQRSKRMESPSLNLFLFSPCTLFFISQSPPAQHTPSPLSSYRYLNSTMILIQQITGT